MTKKVLIACVTAAFISAVALGQNNTQVMNVVEITKIDSKKMTLSVKSDLADGASLSGRGGLPAGGGRGGAGQGGVGGGGGGENYGISVANIGRASGLFG